MNVSNDVIKEIVRYGTLATSADNCQPWLFHWDGHKLDLMMDKNRSGFFYDINHESTYMTLGAVAENIHIAVSHFGCEAKIEFDPAEKSIESLVANITFSKTSRDENPLFKDLNNRAINRYPFTKKTISKSILQELEDEIPSEFQTTIQWFTEESKKRIMQTIVFNADRILFEDKRLHSGLFKWIWTKKENAARLDGMNLDTIGISPLQKPFFKVLADWKSLTQLNKIGISRIPALNSINLLKSSPAYCMLSVSNRNSRAYFDAGRAFERLWIKANSLGLAVQPMAGFVFLMNHYYSNAAADFQQKHKELILRDAQTLKEIGSLEVDNYPTMFLRFGYPKKHNIKSKRRPLDEVLTIKS